ncbi:MAG: DUF3881 family protein [Butyrivibrio sp.]|nr:DUF3881 family protein [Butyrivibrio sp.]
MHKFLRAIGFSTIKSRKELSKLINVSIQQANTREYTTINSGENEIFAQFCTDFADGIGMAVCGEFDEADKFIYEYYYPYLKASRVSSSDDITVERHSATESYAGVCDESRIGVTLIFYLQNMISYIKQQSGKNTAIKGTSLNLSALSVKGTIVLPVAKSSQQKRAIRQKYNDRNRLINAARQGNESAIESLTLNDMDTYTAISKKIKTEDVYSIVDSFFMPYGVECDQYSVLGEILEYRAVVNRYTKETVYIMRISSNGLEFDVCINAVDLIGEPQVGRRFKGNIWMQGFINYPGK